MNRDPTSIFLLPSVKLRALKRTLQEGEIFLPGSPGIACVCLQAPGAPASVPAVLGVGETQLSLAFGCSVLGPVLATVVERGIRAQSRSLLPCTPLLSPHVCVHCGPHHPGHLVSWTPNICPEQWP